MGALAGSWWLSGCSQQAATVPEQPAQPAPTVPPTTAKNEPPEATAVQGDQADAAPTGSQPDLVRRAGVPPLRCDGRRSTYRSFTTSAPE